MGPPGLDDVRRAVRDAWAAGLQHGDLDDDDDDDDDDFFAVGGHSLLVAQIMASLGRTFGARLPLRLFFGSPSVRGLAVAVESHLRELAAFVE